MLLALLLGFDDASPYFPIYGGHQGIDATYGGRTSCIDQLNDPRCSSRFLYSPPSMARPYLSNPRLSFTAETKSCSAPKYRSVV
jgi:hypothetical protein